MSAFYFDGAYRNKEQARPFMPAYTARFEELREAGRYPYNDDFRGHLGITEGNEDTAIYLCQCLRHADELAAKVAAALRDGWTALESVAEPVRYASIIHYGWQNGESGWQEWKDARLVPHNGVMAVIPKGNRTRGNLLLGGHVLVRAA